VAERRAEVRAGRGQREVRQEVTADDTATCPRCGSTNGVSWQGREGREGGTGGRSEDVRACPRDGEFRTAANVRQELALLRAEHAELLAHARATVAAARDGDLYPVGILEPGRRARRTRVPGAAGRPRPARAPDRGVRGAGGHGAGDARRHAAGGRRQALLTAWRDRLDIIPTNIDAFLLERQLYRLRGVEFRLQRVLELVDALDIYDVCLIDCPPSLGVLTDNALVAAGQALVPVQSEDSALRALRLLLEHVHLLVNFPPKIALSKLVNSLKGVSSRRMRQEFPELARHYYRANKLWSGSYFAGSVGGAPVSVLRQYIEQQNRPG
jgi:REP element-mobilizing transposase RayT